MSYVECIPMGRADRKRSPKAKAHTVTMRQLRRTKASRYFS